MRVVCSELAGFIVIRVFLEIINRHKAGMHSKTQPAINIPPAMTAGLVVSHLLSKAYRLCNKREKKKKAA